MFFATAARFILRNRHFILAFMVVMTVFFAWKATQVTLSYEFARILPPDDPTSVAYDNFKKQFGEDGSVMVIGIQDENFFTLEKYNRWQAFTDSIKNMQGIEAVVSVCRLINITRNDSTHVFDVLPVHDGPAVNQAQVDSIKSVIDDLPFYRGFIYNPETHAHIVAVTFDKKELNSSRRIKIVHEIKKLGESFSATSGIPLHYSGMPYIRTSIMEKVSFEMGLFLAMAMFITAVILLLFFRNIVIVLFTLLVVSVAVIWSIGTIALFDYNITLLTGLIPPLIIVIGVPNSIFLLNKYHTEYARHGNQGFALSRMIQRIGFTTFLANLTTSIGFAVFYFTGTRFLMEFGLVAAVNVMTTYIISMILIPVIFSYLSPPDVKHVKHLEAPRINTILEKVNHVVHHQYRKIFIVTAVITLVAVAGMIRIKALGFVVDDLPANDPIYVDLKFFETNFNGVLPLEFSIDTRKPGSALTISTLHKLNKLGRMLSGYKEFSKSLSVADAIKFAYQAYNYGNSKAYVIPTSSLDLANIAGYLGEKKNNQQMFKSFIDSSKQKTRLSVQMADIGSVKMKELISEISPRVDSIFPKSKYDVVITGNSLNFLKGNDYLLKNLLESILLALILISLVMITLFMSVRMIVLSILPSLIPLVITAGVMGFTNTPLKPSTILIFSIAFGIASDQTIYFLTKYRQEMKHINNISRAVTLTIRETGVSMIYTAVILFSGFLIFAVSDFGGTAALGKLISLTLLLSVISNLMLLPAFLIALEKRMTTKAFLEEPLIDVMDEDDDIDHTLLKKK